MDDVLTIYRGCREDIPLSFREPNLADGSDGGPTNLSGLTFKSQVRSTPTGALLFEFTVVGTDLAKGLINLTGVISDTIRICDAFFDIKDNTGKLILPPTPIYIRDPNTHD